MLFASLRTFWLHSSFCTNLTVFHQLGNLLQQTQTAHAPIWLYFMSWHPVPTNTKQRKHPLAVQQKYAFWAIENHHHTTTISKKGESCSAIKCQNCTQIFSTGKTLLRPIDCVLQLADNPVAKTCKVNKINVRFYDKSKVKIILRLNPLCSIFVCQITF